MKYSVFSIIFLIFLDSCSPTLKVKQIDSSKGFLPTDTRLNPSEIIVYDSINLNDYTQFLYIMNGLSMDKYDNYITGTLKNIGGFENYYTQEELEMYVIENGLADRVTSVSDKIGLLHLQRIVGNFLVCETSAEYLGGYNYTFDLKIFNPSNANILLHVKHGAFNWAGLDRPLFNPVFNKYIEWKNRNTNSSIVENEI